MKLRQWQAACISSASTEYKEGFTHFLALATPGAGKTVMASELADQLLKNGDVDLVICFSPSSIVAKDFSESLHLRTKERFDGLIGAKGRSLTYQNLQYLDAGFWQLFDRYRVFVIFDEIHHCAGSNIDNANAWGEQILLNIQNKAKFTLALTGTPWRSDAAPIVLSNYTHPSNKISCNYVYGLSEAITDDVCPYQDIIEHEKVMEYLISSANNKLTELRKVNCDAAGLIVASSVEHARNISVLLKNSFNEDSVVVTYRENEPTSIIQQFRHAKSKWIISVGMISEGTNIPRLQVCCHLTNIKTEMHFRQILGRILRMTDSTNQEAVMYMPAEPKLLEYAYRVKQDVPFEADVVKFEKMKGTEDEGELEDDKEFSTVTFDKKKPVRPSVEMGFEVLTGLNDVSGQADFIDIDGVSEPVEDHFLTSSYERVMNIYGRFQQEAIALGLSDLK